MKKRAAPSKKITKKLNAFFKEKKAEIDPFLREAQKCVWKNNPYSA